MAGERTARSDRRAPGAPAPVWLRALLAVAVVVAFAVVVLELARSGPFAPAQNGLAMPGNASHRLAARPGASRAGGALPGGTWHWQLLATGTPAGRTTGSLEVRAWRLARSCDAGGACIVRLARQLVVPDAPNETADRTQLRPLSGAGRRYEARFAPVATRCSYPNPSTASTPTTSFDRFVLRWLAGSRTIAATETSRYVCHGRVYATSYDWSAHVVAVPALPPLVADRRHAGSADAFRGAAAGICAGIDAQAEPSARAVAADERILGSSTASSAAKSTADADLATRFQPLLSLEVAEYERIPQPPRGALDGLWLRDVGLSRAGLAPGAALLEALAGTATAVSRYYLSADPAERDRALAEAFLARDDAARLRGSALAQRSLERDGLRLPRICTAPPAIGAIFTTPAVPTSA